jgi:hypothetical protein
MRAPHLTLALIVLCLVSLLPAHAQQDESGGTYYKVVVTLDSDSFSEGQLNTIVKRCLDRNLVSGLYRSYNEEAPLRATVILTIFDFSHQDGTYAGTVYSSHTSIRTYPTIIDDLMPEKVGAAVSGSPYDAAFFESFIDREIATVLGEFDQIREAIINYRGE